MFENAPEESGLPVDPTNLQERSSAIYKECLKDLVSMAAQASISVDAEGRISSWDETAELLFGYTSDEVLGHSFTMLIPDDRLHEVQIVHRVLERGASVHGFRTWRRRKDGGLVEVAISLEVIVDCESGKAIGCSTTIRNLGAVTDSMEKACTTATEQTRAQRGLVQKSVFGVVSHELRTPLAEILGMNELLISSGLNQEQEDLARHVQCAARRLLEVVNNFLVQADIECGRQRIFAAPVDLHELVRRIGDELSPAFTQKSVTLEVIFDPKIVEPVYTDGRCLQMVLKQLLSNALKFTKQGRISLQVLLDATTEGNEIIQFRIEDTGEGIPLEVGAEIFQPLQQGDISDTRRYGGAGLGLSIARGLVELLGGSLYLERAQPSGVIAKFTVPVRKQKST